MHRSVSLGHVCCDVTTASNPDEISCAQDVSVMEGHCNVQSCPMLPTLRPQSLQSKSMQPRPSTPSPEELIGAYLVMMMFQAASATPEPRAITLG